MDRGRHDLDGPLERGAPEIRVKPAGLTAAGTSDQDTSAPRRMRSPVVAVATPRGGDVARSQ